MNEPKFCSECETELPADASGELCPQCTLKQKLASNIRRRLEDGTQTGNAESDATQVLDSPAEIKIGQLGEYELLEEIGHGGMGVVYRARHINIGHVVALKVLPDELAKRPDYLRRFQREAAAAAQLNHPNLVRVISAGESDGVHFFAMEFVDGEPLDQRIKRNGSLDPVDALTVCIEVTKALDYAWNTKRLIHRDIKPNNIFLTHGGEVRLGDLGLAKAMEEETTELTSTGAVLGTPHYISPEQARSEKTLDFRSDIYSLGCTLYRMLTGRHPYEGSDPNVIIYKHLHDPPPAILKALPNCPMPLVFLLGKMLKKHPNERHQSYEELMNDMRRVRTLLEKAAGQPAAGSGAQGQLTGAGNRSSGATGPASRRVPAQVYGWVAVGLLALAVVVLWPRWNNADAGKQSVKGSQSSEQRRSGAGATNETGTVVAKTGSSPSPVVAPVSEAKPQDQKSEPSAQPAPLAQAPAGPAKTMELSKTNEVAMLPAAPAKMLPTAVVPLEPQSATDAFASSVASLPAEKQVAAVVAKLKELNPDFDGREQHVITPPIPLPAGASRAPLSASGAGGVVTELQFSTVGVTNIAPVRVLTGLKKLTLLPWTLGQKQSLVDLSPLQGLPLTFLACGNMQVEDLSPLRGMPLTVLSIDNTPVSDLSPLAGMPLTALWCHNTKVTDFSPLGGMPLKELKCDFVPKRDAEALRSIQTLQKINDKTAAMFWMQAGVAPPIGANQRGLPNVATADRAEVVTSDAALKQLGSVYTNSVGAEMVYIPPGDFMLGSTPEEQAWAKTKGELLLKDGAKEGSQPQRTTIRHPLWLGRTEVTVGQWRRFVAETSYQSEAEKRGEADVYDPKKSAWVAIKGFSWRKPNFGYELTDNHPVSCISWNDAVVFCRWLSDREKKAGRMPSGYQIRLPTEAEWEYACRAGTQTKFWWGDSEEDGAGRLNWAGTADGSEFVAPVDHYGERGRNRFGLADMLGNLSEWCLDGLDPAGAHEGYYRGNGTYRMIRGGAFAKGPAGCRCAFRLSNTSTLSFGGIGFRICCGVDPVNATAKAKNQQGAVKGALSSQPPVATGPAKPGQSFVTSTGMELVYIPPGEFMMGSTKEEQAWAVANGSTEEFVKREGKAPRKAMIKQGFWLGRTEVTVGQWKQFVTAAGYATDGEKKGESNVQQEPGMPLVPMKGKSWKDPNFGELPKDNHAVCCISWNDAMAFCEWVTGRERKARRLTAGQAVRLPTEAEWEYACRGGTQTKFWWGDSVDEGKGRLNWQGIADGFMYVSPVDAYGDRGRNKFGLADMLGNVWEWCLDKNDPTQFRRVQRGGAFDCGGANVRCAGRISNAPSFSGGRAGFRVVLGLDVLAKKEAKP